MIAEQSPILNMCAGLPFYPENGSWKTVQGQERAVGHIIQYSCNSGYTLVGPTNRTCLLDGTWLAYDPLCVGMFK